MQRNDTPQGWLQNLCYPRTSAMLSLAGRVTHSPDAHFSFPDSTRPLLGYSGRLAGYSILPINTLARCHVLLAGRFFSFQRHSSLISSHTKCRPPGIPRFLLVFDNTQSTHIMYIMWPGLSCLSFQRQRGGDKFRLRERAAAGEYSG